jgi:hypothetical protein
MLVLSVLLNVLGWVCYAVAVYFGIAGIEGAMTWALYGVMCNALSLVVFFAPVLFGGKRKPRFYRVEDDIIDVEVN